MYGNNIHKNRVDVRNIDGSLLVFERKFRYPVFISSIQIYVSEINKCKKKMIFFFLKIQWIFVKCHRWPWNQQTPLGYVGEIITCLLSGEAYLIPNGAFLLLFICISLNHRAFYKRFEYSLGKFDELDASRNGKVLIRDIIQFHISIKK